MASSSHDVPSVDGQRLALNWAQLLLAPAPAALLAHRWLASGVAAAAPFTTAAAVLVAFLACLWALSVAASSTWLIDPYWTLVPPLLDAFWRRACGGETARSTVWSCLLLVWAIRLTHNYVRREGGLLNLGAREDWRYDEMSKRWGKLWPVVQVVPVYIVQHVLLIGIAAPMGVMKCGGAPFWREAWAPARPQPWWRAVVGGGAAVSTPTIRPWHPIVDPLAVAAAVAGLALAAAADNQLFRFVATRSRRDRAAVLDTGVWAWSRHPNYVGETLWWAAVAAAGWAATGALWPAAGVAINTACLLAVTRMTEARTAAAPGRAAAWAAYCKRTPCWVGWPAKRGD